MRQLGALNPNWKGGKSITSHAYILVRVGVRHHLADVRGYAYEHRLVAEQILGRRLRAGEEVSHRNGKRDDNRAANIVIYPSRHHRAAAQRKGNKRLRIPGERNSKVSCACGCGQRLLRYDTNGRARSYISGHNIHPRRRAKRGG